MKTPTGRPGKHTVDFMMTVSKCVAEGEITYREAAKRYGISHGSVYAWLKKYRNNTLHLTKQPKDLKQKTGEGRAAVLELENRALKLELANMFMELQMLKKAQAFEAQAKKDASSIYTYEDLALSKGHAK
jgi:transposase-like protein